MLVDSPKRPPWRRAPIVAGILLALTLVALGGWMASDTVRHYWFGSAGPTAAAQAKRAAPPLVLPTSDPAALRPLTPENAEAINAAIAVAPGTNPAARPWGVSVAGSSDWARSVDCLTAAVYYEAAAEPISGQEAVAQVVLNRVRHPAFPHTVCGVVFEGSDRRTGCQFSFTCDGSLARIPSKGGWATARAVAIWALAGNVYAPVGWATHYHANYVVPYWASTLLKVATVGRHIFYRWDGGWSAAPVFSARYAGLEPDMLTNASAKLLLDANGNIITAGDAAPPPPTLARPILTNVVPDAATPAGDADKSPRAVVPAGRRWILGVPDATPTPAAKPAAKE